MVLLFDLCQKIRWAYWAMVAFYKKKLTEWYSDFDILEKCPALFLGHWIDKGFFIFILLSFFPLYNALNFLVIFCFLKKQNHLFCMTYWLKNIYITYCCKQKKNNTKNHQKPSTINSCFQNFVLMAIFYFFIGVIMAFNTWQTSNKYRSASCSGLLLSDFTAAEPLEFAGFCSQCDICLLFN